jgi:hypothetical protein
MIKAWLHHFALMAKMRTGLGTDVVVCYMIAATAMIAALLFAGAAGFVWLEDRYGGVVAGLILGGAFLLIAIIALVASAILRRRDSELARLELAAERTAKLIDPRWVTLAMEVGKTLGWRRIVSLAAAGVLAAGLAREWFGEAASKPDDSESRH